MSVSTDDDSTLEQDATFDEPLRRVAYEAGMMLGLEATREEQQYHRRRLARHQYWLHGYGTLAGMAVRVDPETSPDPSVDTTVRILVGPGVGIDALGRELLVHEPYCINLGDWLAATATSRLLEGYDDANDLLWLEVTVRYEDCAVGAQPVLARKLNLGTDPVQPSRTADSIRLELSAALPPAPGSEYRPWAVHRPVADGPPAELTAAEQALIGAATGAELDQLNLHARMLHALDTDGVALEPLTEALAKRAELLLARISMDVTDIDNILVNPAVISVNNLVRPFLVTAEQLAYLARQA